MANESMNGSALRVEQAAQRLEQQRAAGGRGVHRRVGVRVARQSAEAEEREERDVAGGRIAGDRRRQSIERAGRALTVTSIGPDSTSEIPPLTRASSAMSKNGSMRNGFWKLIEPRTTR